jgi:hypothetical protein
MSDHDSIGPLNAATQKEVWPLLGLILFDMAVTVVAIYIAGLITNAL